MKPTLHVTLALAFVLALAAMMPPAASAAPPRCNCGYCEENPDAYCTAFGATNTCNLYTWLYCGAMTGDDESFLLADLDVTSAQCSETLPAQSEEPAAQDQDSLVEPQPDISISNTVEVAG